jgi:hypothetical protein
MMWKYDFPHGAWGYLSCLKNDVRHTSAGNGS